MAVVYVKADRAWFRRAAPLFLDHRPMVREMARAMERPGRTASFAAPEVRVLAARLPADGIAQRALARLEVAEANDRENRQRMLARMDQFRAQARWSDHYPGGEG